MSQKKTDEAPEAAKGGRTKLLAGLAVLLAALGAAYFFLFASSDQAEAAEPVPGAVLALEPVAVNLAGGGYLKIGIALQLTEDAAGHGAGPDGSKALDLVISTYSQADPADVVGAREALKESLEQRIIEAYTDDHGASSVIEIYFTEYVTQ